MRMNENAQGGMRRQQLRVVKKEYGRGRGRGDRREEPRGGGAQRETDEGEHYSGKIDGRTDMDGSIQIKICTLITGIEEVSHCNMQIRIGFKISTEKMIRSPASRTTSTTIPKSLRNSWRYLLTRHSFQKRTFGVRLVDPP